MPECQAFNCTNIRGKAKTSFHQFPNPLELRAERARCRRWIDNLKNAKLHIDTIGFDANRVVCGEHFTSDSFTGFLASHVADSLGSSQEEDSSSLMLSPLSLRLRQALMVQLDRRGERIQS